ncbi:phage tail protein [Pseudoalteromonas translucida]|uniref:Orphan protein could be an antifreeze protein n=1 Tax=Pseudoalteromonas translucida (strain TAC 125) TaxID=326442 RepID=Q3IGN0_PSET1|nr:phage tail protein [Pseudoalteromonas translucida]CAI86629.1 putative orphan protein; could be an antifreeze protein [Pseudoalteromonas translucida]
MSKVVDVVVDTGGDIFGLGRSVFNKTVGALWDSLTPDLPEEDLATLAKGLQKGIDQPRRITFGRDRVGGVIAHQAEVERGEKKFVQMVVLINGTPIDALEEIYIADKPITDYPTESWDYELSDGRHTAANAKAVAKMAGWTNEHIGIDQAHIFIELENNREVFEDGISETEFLIRGARVWDPRDTTQNPDDETTWAWSQNAVLCALHYVRFYGAHEVPFDRLPLGWWIAAINVCDEDAEFKDAAGKITTEKRYTTNGSFTFSSKPLDVLNQLEGCFAGKIFRQMGQWYVRVGAWYGNPTYTINADDVHGNIKIKWHADLRDRANVVRATFTDPEQNYDRTDAPPVVSAGYQAIDNQVLEKSITLPFVRSGTTAQRLATIHLEQTRLGEIELPLKHKGLAAAVGRTVYLNLPNESINNKIYRVVERRFRLDGGVTLMCVEDGPNLWADNLVPGAQDLTPNSDYLVGKPQPIFDVRVTIDGDGNGIIKWNHPAPLAVNEYDVEFINTAADEQVFKTSVTYTQVTIPNLQLGEYTARISAKNIFGQRSLLVAVQFSVLTPTLPTVYVTADYNQITLTADIATAGIGTAFEWEFLGTTESPQSGERVLAQIYNRIGLKSETEYKFRVRSVNHLGASDWVDVIANTTLVDLTEFINGVELTQLSEDAQTLIEDMNTQVDRLRPETENNLPSLIAKNIDALTGLAEKVQVLDAENPNSIPFQIDQLVNIVDVINAENPNNLQQQLADSNSKINDLERVTEVLDETKQNSLPALIKINNIAIEQQRLAQQSIGLSLLNVTSAYTNWRNEYERRAFNNERLIDAAVYVDPDTGTIINRAFAYADESFNSATLMIEGANSKITIASQQIAQSQSRISQAEAQLIIQAAQINQKATFSEVESQIAGALAALQPAYSWQFNTSSEGFDPDSHNATGYIVATAQISSPAISYNAAENPMFRLRVRKHSDATWRGDIKFNGGTTTLHLPEPAGTDFETLTLDATGTAGYMGTITSLEFDLGACDIDFIEVGKRGANDLTLADITARTTELEQDINAATGVMAQYATTAWVNALGYQTQSNVQTLIDSFNAQYSIAATLQEFNDQDIIIKANAAQTWINGAEATIRDQVTSILNSDDGVNQRISVAEQSIDAIAGEISLSITQVSGLKLDVKKLGLNEVIAAYNKMQQDQELAEQSFSLAAANQKLTAVTNDVESLATQTLELAGLYGQNAAYLTSLNQAFANERTARSTTERELRAEITSEGTRTIAQANERLEAVVGYCVDAQGNRVDEPDAMACIALGHDWVDGPLVQLINDYTSVFVNEKGYQTVANVQQFISTFDGQYSITATIQTINDEGIITAAKEAQQWINAAEGTIENIVTQFVNKPNGINDNIAFAYDLIQANADDITVTANAQQQLSVRMGEAEADLNRIDDLVITEQQARATLGTQLRIEFQTQDLAMLATANEFTRAVTGYCVDANGERVDQDDAVQCELDGHTWIDGPAVQRAINISVAYVDEKGYQTQSNVSQLLDTFNATYQVSATLQEFKDNGTLQKANNAQLFINAAEGYIENQITLFNDKEDGVNATFANVKQRLDAAEGAVTTSIKQMQGLELEQQAQGLNDVIAAYNKMMQDQDLATLNVKASLANEKLQAQTTGLESLAKQQLELAAIFNSSNAIITSLNKAVANQYEASVVRDQRYQATFDNVTARFSDVTTAIASIDEANTLRDIEFESFVADTIASFDDVSETFASQNQAFSTLQQTLTAKINDDTEAAKNTAIATAQEYTRTAVGYCLNAQGQITSENDAVQCVADGGSWVNGPLAEFIANMQISDGENTASIKQLRQLFTTVEGKLVARGGWTLDNNGRVVGIAGYNDGEVGNLDLIANVIRQGVMVNGTFVPTIYLDNSDRLNPVQTFRGRLVLSDGHQVSTLNDIKAQDGKDGADGADGADGQDGATGPQGIQGAKGADGLTTYTWLKYADNASGAGLSNSPTNKEYIGFAYNKTTATESTNPADYTWSKIKGEDGANGTDGVPGAKGADGKTTYTWIAYSENVSGSGMYQTPNSNTKYIGIAVNKTTATESGNPADYTWSLFKGADGADGQNGLNGQNGNRGSIEVQIATSTGAWSDATANASVPGSPVEHDRVTIYKSSDAKVQTTKRFNGSSWASYTLRVHGDALIDGTVDGKVFRASSRIESPIIMGGEIVITEPSSDYLDIVGRSLPFGPTADLISWYGPKINGVTWNSSTQSAIYAGMSKSNAVSYKTNNGGFYFGGTFQAGTLSISRQATNTSGGLNVLTGSFTIPGGTTSINVTASVTGRGGASGGGTCPTSPYKPSSTVDIEMLVGGTWQAIAGNNAIGTASCTQEGPEIILSVTTGVSANTNLTVSQGQLLQLRAVARTVSFPYNEAGLKMSGSRSLSIVVTGSN